MPFVARPRAARIALIAYAVIFVASLLLHLAFERQPFPQRMWAGLALGVAMPVLAAYLLLSAPRTRVVRCTVIALGFSWLGDAFGFTLLIKLGCFLVAQIAYCVAFWPYRQLVVRRLPLVLIYAAGIAAALGVVVVHAGPMGVWVVAYGVTLGLMAVLAFGVSLTAGVGGLMFVLSDIVLGVNAFVAPELLSYPGALNSVLYLPAQELLVLAVIRRAIASNPQRSD